MVQGEAAAKSGKTTLRKIVDFPLVAMLIGVVLVFAGLFAALLVTQLLLPPIPGFTTDMKFKLLGAVILIPVYKIAIRHLGRHPRDDLRLPGALRPFAVGIGTGV